MLFVEDEVDNLTKRLDMLDLEASVSMVFVVEQYSTMVSEGMRGVKGNIPPQLAGLKPILDVPERTKVFALTLDPEREVMIKLTAEQADASMADDSAKAVRQAYDAAKGLYALLGKDALSQNTPPDVRDALLKTVDSLLENVKTESDGKNLVISVKRPDGLEELLKKARPIIKEKMNAG